MAVLRQYANVAKLLYAQSLIGCSVSLVFVFVLGWQSGLSALSGAAIAIVANAYFAVRFLLRAGWNAQAIVRAFYAGEAVKWLMTAAFFFIALQVPSVSFPALLAGFVAALSVQWFALLFWRG